MQGVEGVQVEGHQPDRGEGGGDLARHDAALAHPGDHQFGALVGAAVQQGQSGIHLLGIEAPGGRGDGGRLFLKTARQCRHPGAPQLLGTVWLEPGQG